MPSDRALQFDSYFFLGGCLMAHNHQGQAPKAKAKFPHTKGGGNKQKANRRKAKK